MHLYAETDCSGTWMILCLFSFMETLNPKTNSSYLSYFGANKQLWGMLFCSDARTQRSSEIYSSTAQKTLKRKRERERERERESLRVLKTVEYILVKVLSWHVRWMCEDMLEFQQMACTCHSLCWRRRIIGLFSYCIHICLFLKGLKRLYLPPFWNVRKQLHCERSFHFINQKQLETNSVTD